tara:strand:- start:857 stop:1204 length:348 start_codon:yes stop_codon:yes gene_type:complete
MSEESESYDRDQRGRFAAGNRGGPGGKIGQKKFSLKRALERIIEKQEAEGRDVLDALAVAAIKAAGEGDFRFWKEIIDRFDGPIRQQIEQDQTIFIERISRAVQEQGDETVSESD